MGAISYHHYLLLNNILNIFAMTDFISTVHNSDGGSGGHPLGDDPARNSGSSSARKAGRNGPSQEGTRQACVSCVEATYWLYLLTLYLYMSKIDQLTNTVSIFEQSNP